MTLINLIKVCTGVQPAGIYSNCAADVEPKISFSTSCVSEMTCRMSSVLLMVASLVVLVAGDCIEDARKDVNSTVGPLPFPSYDVCPPVIYQDIDSQGGSLNKLTSSAINF